jgi:hypothetical protein
MYNPGDLGQSIKLLDSDGKRKMSWARRERGTFDDACKRAVVYANRHSGDLDMAENFLDRAGWGQATFGVEAVQVGDRELRYLNTGDTYDLTVGQEGDGPVFDTSWGDWAEMAEQEHCEAGGVIRCGNCGEFTPSAENWTETICKHCGNDIDGN